MRKKHIFMGVVATVVLLLAVFVIFVISKTESSVPFITEESGLRAQLAEPAWLGENIVGVLPGALVAKDPRVVNQSNKEVYVALRIEILTGTGELLSAEQADMLFRLVKMEESGERPWRLVIPTERDEATQIWVYCGDGDKAVALAPGKSTDAVFVGLRFEGSLRNAQRNWLEGNADLQVEGADGNAYAIPALEKGFQIRYTGALLSAESIDSSEQNVAAKLYEMFNTGEI